jgi:xanthine dehydrogenase accessory factor
MHKWITDLANLQAPRVLVTVATVRGSAPREVGARMIVTPKETIGTIGGGQLEYQCTRIACEQLDSDRDVAANSWIRQFVLGANCGQCCGGVVEVMFEVVTASGSAWLAPLRALYRERTAVVMATSLKSPGRKFLITAKSQVPFGDNAYCPELIVQAARSMLGGVCEAQTVDEYLLQTIRPNTFNVAVFGAGHVGAAIVDVMRRLDCNIRWIDGRRNIFPASLPENVLAVESADPAREVPGMPPGSWYLIMTHSHPLDQEICARVLRREDFAYCGLIGSVSKRRRFERLLQKQGVPISLLNRLVCPIGTDGIEGKRPAEIAIAVAAEILQIRDALLHKVVATGDKQDNVRAI